MRNARVCAIGERTRDRIVNVVGIGIGGGAESQMADSRGWR